MLQGTGESTSRRNTRLRPLALHFFAGLTIFLLPLFPLSLRRTVASPKAGPRNGFVLADQLLRRVRGLRFGCGCGFRRRRGGSDMGRLARPRGRRARGYDETADQVREQQISPDHQLALPQVRDPDACSRSSLSTMLR